ncbi:NAD(P)-binding domain-containing protein, partial [Streptomyces sp. NPDC004778]
KIGIIGAGNIGGNLTRRLTALGHEVSADGDPSTAENRLHVRGSS